MDVPHDFLAQPDATKRGSIRRSVSLICTLLVAAGVVLTTRSPAVAVTCPTTTLHVGQALSTSGPCYSLTSANHSFTLGLSDDALRLSQTVETSNGPDGPLPIFVIGGSWTAQMIDATGSSTLTLRITRSGNLEAVGAGSKVLWQTATSNSGTDNRLTVQDSGDLVLTNSAGRVLWSSGSGRSALGVGAPLTAGQRLIHIVHYYTHTTSGWHPRTYVMVGTMQPGGDFVVRCNGHSQTAWHTNTHVPGSWMQMGTNGLLAVVAPGHRFLWSDRRWNQPYALAYMGTRVLGPDGLVWKAPLSDPSCVAPNVK